MFVEGCSYILYRQIRREWQRLIVLGVFGQRDSVPKGFQEKFLNLDDKYPYRKPTQVVEERILRCSRDSWLRN